MCLSPERYVELKVYTRLIEHGVTEARAAAVARKVRWRYAEKRRNRMLALSDKAC